MVYFSSCEKVLSLVPLGRFQEVGSWRREILKPTLPRVLVVHIVMPRGCVAAIFAELNSFTPWSNVLLNQLIYIYII